MLGRFRTVSETSGAYAAGETCGAEIPCGAEESVAGARGIRIFHKCGGCGKKREFLNSTKFRVNANGNTVDVWLIYRCIKCKHSWNLTIYERTRPGRIPAELFEAFQENDEETAMKYGQDVAFLKKNHAEFN